MVEKSLHLLQLIAFAAEVFIFGPPRSSSVDYSRLPMAHTRLVLFGIAEYLAEENWRLDGSFGVVI
jgi:hypothetical protein